MKADTPDLSKLFKNPNKGVGDNGRNATPYPALGEDRPLTAFTGVWTNWTSVRKVKGGEVTADLFAFLTCEPNRTVAVIQSRLRVSSSSAIFG